MDLGAYRLPADVLVKIFSYLPCEDLVKSVQFVCTWWQQVSWEKQLWKYITYQPDVGFKNIIQMLKLSPQLRILNLTFATVDNDLIQFITDSCPNLERLHIHWFKIYNNSRITITRPVSQIKMLTLRNGKYGLDFQYLDFPYLDSAFPNLESLGIVQMKFDKKDLEHYLQKKQKTLHTLSIPCCTADDLCVLPCLSVCTKLRNLCLYRVCDKALSCKEVRCFANISHLTLYRADMSNVNDSSPAFCSFPNITSLELEFVKLSENILCIIARNCPQLQELKFSFCGGPSVFVEDTLHAIRLERLTHLYINDNASLTDEGIKHILRLMPGLIYLDLYECECLTTECFKFICGISKLEVFKFDLSKENVHVIFELEACDVANKNLQLILYDWEIDLNFMRQEKLRVYQTSYTKCWKEHCDDMYVDMIARRASWYKHCCLCCR